MNDAKLCTLGATIVATVWGCLLGHLSYHLLMNRLGLDAEVNEAGEEQ